MGHRLRLPFIMFFIVWFAWTASGTARAGADPDLLRHWSRPAPGLSFGQISHAVEVDLPPAAAGLVPDLGFTASPAAVDGILGAGWALRGSSRIERRSDTFGVPHMDSSDIYLVDGQPLHTAYTLSMPGCDMRAEQDDNRCFAFDSSANTWTARRDGWTWTYGELSGEADSGGTCAVEHMEESWDRPCTQYPGEGDALTATAWLLSEIEDPHGNTITLDYAVPETCALPDCTVLDEEFAWAHQLSRVRYADGYHEVNLEHELRPDMRASARSGRLRFQPWRLAALQVVVDAQRSAVDDARYELEYIDQAMAVQDSGGGDQACDGGPLDGPANESTYLHRIWRVGASTERLVRCITSDQTPTTFDLDDDGGRELDFTWPNISGSTISWDSSGAGTSNTRIEDTGVWTTPLAISVDGELRPDLALLTSTCKGGANPTECQVEHRVYELDDDGALVEDTVLSEFMEAAISPELLYDLGWYAFTDFNRDGTEEVLTLDDIGNDAVHLYHGTPIPWTLTGWVSGLDSDDLKGGVIVDVNGDGHQDLLLPPNHRSGVAGAGTLSNSTDYRWIPNTGEEPYWDAGNVAVLTLPHDQMGSVRSDIEDMWDSCETDDDTVRYPNVTAASGLMGILPDHPRWFGTWADADEFLASQTRWSDVNADGNVDAVVAFHTCFWDEASGNQGPATGDGIYTNVFLGDGAGEFLPADQVAAGPFLLESANHHDAGELSSGFDQQTWYEDWFGLGAGEPYLQTVGAWAAMDLDRNGLVDIIQGSDLGASGLLELWAMGDMGWHFGFGLQEPSLAGTDWTTSETHTTHAEAWRSELPWHAFTDLSPPSNHLLPGDWDGDGFVDLLRLRLPVDGEVDAYAGLFTNERTVGLGRVTEIQGAWGGVTELSYSFSSEAGDNPELPMNIEVLRHLTDAQGTTELSYHGGRYEDGRFLGFRDVVSRLESGKTTHSRFAQTESMAGTLTYHAEYRPDGAMETFRYVDSFQQSTMSLDDTPPYFNPPRRHCDFWLEPGPETAPWMQGVEIYELIEACLAIDAEGGAPLAEEVWDALNWGEDEDWTAAPVDGGQIIDTASFADLAVSAPSGIPEPETPTASQTYGSGNGDYLLELTTRTYVSQRIETVSRWRDVTTSDDDRFTVYEWDSWDSAAMGMELLAEELQTTGGSVENRRERSSFGDFDTPGEITQVAGSSQRTWTYTHDRGDIATVRDPMGWRTSLDRGDCGQLERRVDAEGREEVWTHDAACRVSTHESEGATRTTTRDDFGRPARVEVDPGGSGTMMVTSVLRDDELGTPDDRQSLNEPREAELRGDGSLALVYRDPWGRQVRRTVCEQGTWSGSEGSVADILTEVSCNSGSAPLRINQDRLFASDGTLRATTQWFDAQTAADDEVAATWRYHDAFGREAARLDPAPDDTSEAGFSPDWVLTRSAFMPGQVDVTDALLQSCTTTWDTLNLERACGLDDRGSLRFDAMGKIVEETDPDGVSTITLYDDFQRPTSRLVSTAVTVFPGNTTVIPNWQTSYDDNDRVTEQTDTYGHTWSWDYDRVGRPTQAEVEDADTATTLILGTWSYTDVSTSGVSQPEIVEADIDENERLTVFDGLGRPLSTTGEDGSTASYAYDEVGRLDWSEDMDGVVTWRDYDVAGRLVEEELGSTGSTWLAYADSGLLLSVEDRDGVVTEHDWTWDGRRARTRRPRASGSDDWDLGEWIYDDLGQVIEAFDGASWSTYEYDHLGRLAVAYEGVDPATGSYIHEIEWEWTDTDRVEFHVRDGIETEFAWNALGWRESVTYHDSAGGSATRSWLYNANGHVRQHTDEAMLESYWDVDTLGRVVFEELPGQASRSISYLQGVPASGVISSTSGSLTEVEVIEPDGGLWLSWSDHAGRVVREEYPDGRALERQFSGSLLTQERHLDASANITARELWTYDIDARLDQSWGPVDEATYQARSHSPASGDYVFSRTWTAAGRPDSIAGPNDLTTWTYADGVVESEIVDGVTTISYGYQTESPVLETIETGDGSANVRTITREYEAGLYVSKITAEDGTDTVVRDFSGWDSFGTPREMSTSFNGTPETYTQVATDDRGRVASLYQTVGGAPLGLATYGYLDNGYLDSLEMAWSASGQKVALFYDRPGSDLELGGIVDGAGNLLAEFQQRDDLGRPESIALAGGAQIEMTWDQLGRIETHDIRNPGTGTTPAAWSHRTYTYDDRGRMETLDVDGAITSYVYAEPGWLAEEHHAQGTPDEAHRYYDYDAAGNRVRTEVFDAAGNQTSLVEYSYDPGNVLADRTESGVTESYTWDAFGGLVLDPVEDVELTRYPTGEVADVLDTGAGSASVYTMIRDAFGRPVGLEDASGNTRDQLWGNPGGSWPLAGVDDKGDEVMWVAAEGLLLGKIINGSSTDMATDTLGSLQLVGTEWIESTGAFGDHTEPAQSVSTRFVYAGLEHLPDTPGYQLAERRLYHAETGRFASLDPLGLAAGPNRFIYANNDPLAFKDPTGLCPTGPTGNSPIWTALARNVSAIAAGKLPIRCTGNNCYVDRTRWAQPDLGPGVGAGDGPGLRCMGAMCNTGETGEEGDTEEDKDGDTSSPNEEDGGHKTHPNDGPDRLWWHLEPNEANSPTLCGGSLCDAYYRYDEFASGNLRNIEAAASNVVDSKLDALSDAVDAAIENPYEVVGEVVLEALPHQGVIEAARYLDRNPGDLSGAYGAGLTAHLTPKIEKLKKVAIASAAPFALASSATDVVLASTSGVQETEDAINSGVETVANTIDGGTTMVALVARANPAAAAKDVIGDPSRAMMLVVLNDSDSGACFVAGTQVLTTNGSVPIEAILPGDIVLAAVTDVPDQPWTEVNPTNPLLQPQGTPPHDLDTWDPEAAHRLPQPQDHVFVLGTTNHHNLTTLQHVSPGQTVAFQGRLFQTDDADNDGRLELWWNGDVLARVIHTFSRHTSRVIHADIAYSHGSNHTITGTPNHPFWVDALRDYVPLGELELGTVLHVQGGGEAILVSKTWRQGDFKVFDFEVEGLHNFYVRGEGSDAAGVLVHNSTGGKVQEVIDETVGGSGNLTSRHTLSGDEALDAGEQWVRDGYREIGKEGSGVFRSADDTRQFRMDDGSLEGAHAPGVPHVHLEEVAPDGRTITTNNHVPFED